MTTRLSMLFSTVARQLLCTTTASLNGSNACPYPSRVHSFPK
jgi:hypothetical protein